MLSYAEIFDVQRFLKSKRSSDFYKRLTETQMFSVFIETQVLGGNNETEINCYNRIAEGGKGEIVKPEISEVYNVMLPNSRGLDSKESFTYSKFPTLSDKYLVKPRFIDLLESRVIDTSVTYTCTVDRQRQQLGALLNRRDSQSLGRSVHKQRSLLPQALPRGNARLRVKGPFRSGSARTCTVNP